jgi:predicted RNase H-like nuclease (RuvC/YqgF family)
MDDKEYFNLSKMLLIKAGSETYSFSKIGDTLASMKVVIYYQKARIAELENRLNNRDSERDKEFDQMYSRAINAERRVKELEEEVETLTQRCDKFKELNLLRNT